MVETAPVTDPPLLNQSDLIDETYLSTDAEENVTDENAEDLSTDAEEHVTDENATDKTEEPRTGSHDNDGTETETDETDDSGSGLLDNDPIDENLGQGYRQKQRSTRLKDFACNTIHETSCYPIEDFLSSAKFSENYRQFLAAITASTVPQTYSQAMDDPNFQVAMKHEIVALEDSGTWTVEDLPPGKKALGCKWVYCIK